MASTKLTRNKILALKAGTKYYEVSDNEAEALSVAVQPLPSGAKSFVMRFRRPSKKQGKLSLGPFDSSNRETVNNPVIGQPLTVDEAHVLAAGVNLQRAKGIDVIAVHQAGKRHVVDQTKATFPVHTRDYIDQWARPKNRGWRSKARMLGYQYPHRSDDAPEIIKGGISDRWRDRLISEIDGDDLFGVVEEAKKNGIPGLFLKTTESSDARARHFSAALGSLFGWLVKQRRIKINPYSGVYRPPALKARDHVLNIRTDIRDADELRWFWAAATAMAYPYGDVVRVLLLTGCRRAEIAKMRWSELSDDFATLRLSGERTKNKSAHVVPLSAPAREIIASVPRLSEEIVFSVVGSVPITNFDAYKTRLDALMMVEAVKERGREAVIANWRLHDLRRSCATGMAEIGVAPHVVEAVLKSCDRIQGRGRRDLQQI